MLRNVKELSGYSVHAKDGVMGEVDDLYFDDEAWAIRYLVVDTGRWLSGRKVLIPPAAIGRPDWLGQTLSVSLTKAQVEGCPPIDTRKPVSRQHEAEYSKYFGYPYYWGAGDLWGPGAYPGALALEIEVAEAAKGRPAAAMQNPDDSHLRSCRAVTGYHIHASDGDIGHVDDFLVDDHTWAIRYLIVDTSNWWGGHQVLVAPQWIDAVSWSESKVTVPMTRESVKHAPAYASAAQLDRQQEQGIYEHYGHAGYWTTDAIRDAAEEPPARRPVRPTR